MYGLTRATLTLIGAAAAGVMLWLATTILPDERVRRFTGRLLGGVRPGGARRA